MTNLTNSWVAIPRSIQDESFYTDSHCVHILTHIMLSVSVKTHIHKSILVEKGQYLTSRKIISQKTKIQESKVERTLNLLEKLGYIEQQKTTKYRFISIALEDFTNIFEQHVNSKRTTDEQQANSKRTQSTSNTSKTDKQVDTIKDTNVSKKTKGERFDFKKHVSDVWLNESRRVRPDFTDNDIKEQMENFTDYWIALPGAKGVKLDWLATWRGWIRRSNSKTKTFKNKKQDNMDF